MSANAPLPPPAPLPPSPTSPLRWYPDGNNPEVRGIKKALMIAGLAAGFTSYIVPGIFGVRTYRQWKRGEAPTPLGWMTYGVVYWLFWGSLIAATIATDGFAGM